MSEGALFPDLLGPCWPSLPPSVRAMHGGRPLVRARGRVDVEGDMRLPARTLRALFRLPAPMSGAAIEVEIRQQAGAETWTRRFPGRVMRSHLRRSPRPDAFEEVIGASRFAFSPHCADGTLRWTACEVRLLGLPLPLRWFHGIAASCGEQEGRYRFAAAARLPWIGLLVAYSGWLEPLDAD
jgi:hypothetical protein